MGGEFDFPTLAGDHVDSAGSETDAHAAGDVAEEGAHQTTPATTDEQAIGVTFVIMLFLDDFTFGDFHVLARLAVGIDAWAADGHDAHLDGDEAAVNFNAFEGEIHVGLAAEEREIFGFLDGADNTVDASAGGKKDAAVESDGLSKDGDEGITFAADGCADWSKQREMDFGAWDELARLGGNGRW